MVDTVEEFPDPLEHIHFIDQNRRPQAGYRMKLDTNWLVVMEIDPRSGLRPDAVDLVIFLNPPEGLEDKQA